MSMIDSGDEMLHNAMQAAAKYKVSDDVVEQLQPLLPTGRLHRMVSSSGWLTASVIKIANAHHAECAPFDCATCTEIRKALSAVMAFVRAETDADLRMMLDTRRRSRLGRWLDGRVYAVMKRI
jgi:hypothetical protein